MGISAFLAHLLPKKENRTDDRTREDAGDDPDTDVTQFATVITEEDHRRAAAKTTHRGC